MVAATLARLFVGDTELASVLSDLATRTMKNWNGITVGQIRPAGPLA